MSDSWTLITDELSRAHGHDFSGARRRSIGGGSINSAWLLEAGERRAFIKLNSIEQLHMFEAEAEGLQALAHSQTLHIPTPYCYGVAGRHSYLAMEYLNLGSGNSNSMRRLGKGLATMHRHSQTEHGWHRDNTIGSTPQVNTRNADWPGFFGQQRLGFQLQLAAQNGADQRTLQRGQRLSDALDSFFSSYQPQPSLLHGDLWSGNYAILANGDPTIFDPAVYYGDRETDLAMTELFGGFSGDFYDSYNASWPLDPGYRTRKTLYNLYHILNHFNLFGGGYINQAAHMIDELLSEIRGD